ncbi:MFS transporter [Brucella anthropi]|nr:MFS transporter [Brucella anthropi]
MESAVSLEGILAFILFALSLIAFIWQERRAKEPMVAPDLWLKRPIAFSNLAVFLASMSIMGLTTFLPMYVQTVLDRSPVVAGFALTMLLLGWPCGATIASRQFTRFGLRPIMIAGSICIPIGTSLLVMLTPSSSATLAGTGSLIMGFGMGLLNIGALILTQDSVSWSERGSATASNVFSRNLGSTLGAAILGAVLTYGLANANHGEAITSDQLRDLLNGAEMLIDQQELRLALQHGLHATFVAMMLIAVLIVPACLCVPGVKKTYEENVVT